MLSVRSFAVVSTLSAVLAGSAIAQVPLGGMVTGNDYDRILEIAGAYGPVERRSDGDGQWIRAEMNDIVYSISFLNCDDNGMNCGSVQFRAWWESNGSHDVFGMNQWNRDRRFSAAYMDAEDNATIEFDVNLAGGVTAVNFDDTLQWWEAVLGQFKDMVIDPGFRGEPPATSDTPDPVMPPPSSAPTK
jgi:hypothetical protein